MIYLDSDLCKGCNICVNACKKGVYLASCDINCKGVHIPGIDKPENCVKCGLCEIMCPDQAIKVDVDE